MAELIIVTGPAGVGKSTVSGVLAGSFDKSALIEGDDIYAQVVGGYIEPWKEGNHLDTFLKVCINSIKTYLESGYNVVFNYIISPGQLSVIMDELSGYQIKFAVLMVDGSVLLNRDKLRPEEQQMNDRCIVLLNEFKKFNYPDSYVIDSSSLAVQDVVNMILSDDRFVL